MGFRLRAYWDGHAETGKQVTIPIPFAKDNADGEPVSLDLSTGTPTMSSVTKPDGSGGTTTFTASISQSGVTGEEHIGLVVLGSSDVDAEGEYSFKVYFDSERAGPTYVVVVEAA